MVLPQNLLSSEGKLPQTYIRLLCSLLSVRLKLYIGHMAGSEILKKRGKFRGKFDKTLQPLHHPYLIDSPLVHAFPTVSVFSTTCIIITNYYEVV